MMSALKGKSKAGLGAATLKSRPLGYNPTPTCAALAPVATSSLDELTMADVVPMALRMSMREEVVEQTVDEDAKEAAELIIEQKRNLKSRQGQSFQVFHPEAAKALDIQSKAIQPTNLFHQETERPSARRSRQWRRQYRMQSVAESCVYSRGVEMLWKTNLEVLRQKKKCSLQMEHGLFCPIDVDEDATRVTPQTYPCSTRLS